MARMKNRDSNKARRADRQVQAKVRQDLYAALTPAQKLAKLDAGGYDAVKQRKRLKAAQAPVAEKPKAKKAAK
jgi:Spy/CpxP family protein refolding chaperone